MTVAAMGRRERKKLAVRENILEETTLLLCSGGVAGTTIDAICDSCDIAKKTFYNYYNSKHELLLDICQSRLLDHLAVTIDEAVASAGGLAQRIDYIFGEVARRNSQAGLLERELIEYMVANLSLNPSQGAGQLTLMNRYYQALFEAHQDELRPGLTPAFCAEMVVGMSNAITLNWLHRDDYDPQQRFFQLAGYLKQSMVRAAWTLPNKAQETP